MPKNRQIEDKVDQEEITYTDLKLSKSQQKQRILNKDQSPVLASGQEINYAQLEFHRKSQPQHRMQLVREPRKELLSITWRKIAGILAVLCIVLFTIMGILLSNLFSSREEQSMNTSPFPSLSSEDNGCSSELCSHNWIGYGKSYYHSFCETKTWAESQAACAELNSHLLKIDTEEERKLFSEFEITGWTACKTNANSDPWVWGNVSQVKDHLVSFLESKNLCCAYMS